MEFKTLLLQILKERGLTQSSFAKASNIPKTTINGWINANRLPDFTTLKILAQFFNVSADYLLGLTNNDIPNWEN